MKALGVPAWLNWGSFGGRGDVSMLSADLNLQLRRGPGVEQEKRADSAFNSFNKASGGCEFRGSRQNFLVPKVWGKLVFVLRLSLTLCLLSSLVACLPSRDERSDSQDASAEEGARELVLGLPTYYELEDHYLEALRAHLETHMGLPVRFRITDGHDLLPRLVSVGAIDAAVLPARPFVKLQAEKAEITPLLSILISATPTYLGHIYVASDSAYQRLSDLEGASIAFVSKGSTSGYLMVRALLREQGYAPEHFFGREEFFDGHQNVLDAVRSGVVDAGAAIDATVLAPRFPVNTEGLRVVAKTQRVPFDVVVVHSSYSPVSAAALQQALLDLNKPSEGQPSIASALGITGFGTFHESRYDSLKAALQFEPELLGPPPKR